MYLQESQRARGPGGIGIESQRASKRAELREKRFTFPAAKDTSTAAATREAAPAAGKVDDKPGQEDSKDSSYSCLQSQDSRV